MHLLLCAATEFEIRPVMEWLGKEKIQHVEVVITGIGLAAATYAITKTVNTKRPDFILQAGIAGTFDQRLPLTKIVFIENEMIGDMGVIENGQFQSMFDLELINQNEYPWINGKLLNNMGALKETELTIVNGITVNEITTSKERIAYYLNEKGASVESMEGAALHYVALMEKIPFLQVRSLSNFAGERDKSRWMTGMAINSLNIELKKIILKINRQ